jgi:hypothetical protein
MKGFCCDRCKTWYGSENGARIQVRKSTDTDKNNPEIVDLCDRCVSGFQSWLLIGSKTDSP